MNVPDKIIRAIEDATPHFEVRAIVHYLVVIFIETGCLPSQPIDTPAIMCFKKSAPSSKKSFFVAAAPPSIAVAANSKSNRLK